MVFFLNLDAPLSKMGHFVQQSYVHCDNLSALLAALVFRWLRYHPSAAFKRRGWQKSIRGQNDRGP
jgi:hypothetical protein